MYITNIVVFLTAFSIRVSLLSSKIHNGDDTPKGYIRNNNPTSAYAMHVKITKTLY